MLKSGKTRAMQAMTVTVWLATRRSLFRRAISQKSRIQMARKSGAKMRWCPMEMALWLYCSAIEYRRPYEKNMISVTEVIRLALPQLLNSRRKSSSSSMPAARVISRERQMLMASTASMLCAYRARTG